MTSEDAENDPRFAKVVKRHRPLSATVHYRLSSPQRGRPAVSPAK